MASDAAEVAALDARYSTAMAIASTNGTDAIAAKLEHETTTRSRVVVSRDSNEVFRLACGDDQVYTTYYNLVEAGLRLPTDSKWDSIRPLVDDKMFPYYKAEVCFGALTLDETGVAHFGDCHMILKTELVGFRTTTFTENSAAFVARNNFTVPPGHRATWEQRGRLAVAKLASALTASATGTDLPAILKSNGPTPDDDSFVEAHTYGPFSMRTVEQVSISHGARTSVRLKALREKLKKLGVPLVVV